ncbi:MAG: T9SS type A sorting domain-containing protein [Flavobacteriales bacterium]
MPLALVVGLAVEATAQNLVPNGSFEDTVNCDVSTQCSLLKAMHWYNANWGTSPDVWDVDLDRSCGYPMDPSNPEEIGFLNAQDGTRYAGEYFWDGPGNSGNEYAMVQLTEPLVAGQAYRMSLYYSLSNFALAVDHIGVWFGTDSLHGNTPGRLDEVPQLKLRDPLHTYLTVDDAWVQLTDTLVAAGGEQWMVIGNFDEADSINGITVHPGNYLIAYYFFDNISLTRVSDVGIDEVKTNVWWNGKGISINAARNGPLHLSLWDMSGRMLATSEWEQGRTTGNWPGPPLSDGVYILRIQGGGRNQAVKFVKEEGGL